MAIIQAKEAELMERTQWVLKNNTFVRDFQKFRENAKVKNWQAIHRYEKEDMAPTRLQMS